MRGALIPALGSGPTHSDGRYRRLIGAHMQAYARLHRSAYAPMKLPSLERTWTVAFTVDASRCATDVGSFSIQFTLWKENAPDTEFVETFRWKPDLNVISKQFSVDEAIGAYPVTEIDPCPCRKQFRVINLALHRVCSSVGSS